MKKLGFRYEKEIPYECNNGSVMREADIVAKVFGIELVSLGYDCALTFQEYKKLYTDCYGKLVGMNIREVKPDKK